MSVTNTHRLISSEAGWTHHSPTPEGWRAELTYLGDWLHTEMVLVIHLTTDPAAHSRELTRVLLITCPTP